MRAAQRRASPHTLAAYRRDLTDFSEFLARIGHNFIDGKQYHLEAKVLERETVNVEAGSFDCYVVEPITQSVGLFQHEGQLKVWLTADRLRMPVLMKSKILVGSISAELTDYKLGDIGDLQ